MPAYFITLSSLLLSSVLVAGAFTICNKNKSSLSFPPLFLLGHLVNIHDYNTILLTDAESSTAIDLRHFQYPVSTVTVESGPNVPPSCARKDGDPWPLYDLSRLQEKPSLYVIAVSFGKFPLAARFLNNTVTLCPDKVEPGAFDKRNILVFWMPDSDNDVSRGVNEVFFDENIQRHPIVIAIRGSAKETEDPSLAFSLLSWRFNPYAGKLVPQAFPVKFDDNNLFNKKSFFYSFALQGFVVKVGFLPFAPWCLGNVDYFSSDPYHMFHDFSGSDLLVLETLCQKIGCKLNFYNPIDFQWGYVAKGVSTGMFKLLVEKKVDILACSQYFSGRSLQVSLPSQGIFLSNPMVAVSQKAKLDRSFYSLLRPFQYPIWIGICVLIIVFPFVLCSIAKLEYQFCKHSLFWTNLGDSAWYVYGSFLGEGVTGTIDSEQAWGLRISVVLWLWYSFIVTASYGGELRAFLLKPKLNSPIDTIMDIVDSGFPWRVVDYGDGM